MALTPEQLQAIRERTGIQPAQPQATTNVASELDAAWGQPQQPTFTEQLTENIGGALSERKQRIQSAAEREVAGKASPWETAVAATGNVIGGAFDVPIQAAKTLIDRGEQKRRDIYKETTGMEMPESTIDIGGAIGKGITKAGGAVTSVLEKIPGYAQFWDNVAKLEQEDPEAFKTVVETLKSGVDIAGVIPTERIATAGVKTATGAIGKELAEQKSLQATQAIARKSLAEIEKKAARVAVQAPTIKQQLVAKVGKSAANIPEDTISRVVADKDYAMSVKQVVDKLENPEFAKSPYFETTQKVADAIKTADETAVSQFRNELSNYINANEGITFDISNKLPNIISKVDEMKGSGIFYDTVRDSAGRIKGYKIQKTPQSPFTSEEIAKLNGLIDVIQNSKAIDADNLIAVTQKFDTIYNSVPLSPTGTPTKFHALVMGLKENAEKQIGELMPPEIRKAYDDFAEMQQIKTRIGNKVIDADGNIRYGAESFIANSLNQNKGQLASDLKKFSDKLGVDIPYEAKIIKDALELSRETPRTGSRIHDLLTSTVFPATGGAIGTIFGPVGTGMGAIAGQQIGKTLTSPKFIGKQLLPETKPGIIEKAVKK